MKSRPINSKACPREIEGEKGAAKECECGDGGGEEVRCSRAESGMGDGEADIGSGVPEKLDLGTDTEIAKEGGEVDDGSP